MKKILFSALALGSSLIYAQETEATTAPTPETDTIKHWSIEGQNTIMLNQAAFSN